MSSCRRGLEAKSLINDILALRKRFPASSLAHGWTKCSRGPKKDESSVYDGGGIDPPATTPSPVLSTVSPSSSSSSEGFSTTYVLLALAINSSCESCNRAVANSSCSSNPVQVFEQRRWRPCGRAGQGRSGGSLTPRLTLCLAHRSPAPLPVRLRSIMR